MTAHDFDIPYVCKFRVKSDPNIHWSRYGKWVHVNIWGPQND